jgi:glycosyltransferase involved in cell wall biosynthesis
VPYAEDQLLAREMIEAGYRKAYNPEAAVLHSHDYPPGEFFKRYFDEWRSLREVLGHVEPVGPRKTPQDIWYLVKADRAYLREVEQRSKPASLIPMAKSARHHALRISAAALGSRADALPKRVRGALSLEGRDSFVTYELPQSPLSANGDRRPAAPTTPAEAEWEFDFVRRAFPRRPLLLEPARDLAGKESLKIAWIVPAWTRGSGGHMTIFRLIQMLERRGHECSIHVFDPRHYDPRPAHELAASLRDEFLKLDAPVLKGLDDWAGADVGVATNWWTAYPLRDLPFCAEKVYLVQDFEPDFYARSAEYLWAEETYRMGYRGIAYTPWMADILRERYGMEAAPFDCGTDLLTYQLGADASRDPATIAVYARQETERRAVQLSLAALGTLKERRPEVEVVAFGTDRRLRAPLELHNIGVAPPAALAALYQRATAGLCLSLTTHSLVAQEMMASGLPVVELEGDNVSSALGGSGRLAMLAEPTPDSIADALERVLDDRPAAAAMAERARAFVEERTWERAGDQVESALRDYLARPRAPAAVSQ